MPTRNRKNKSARGTGAAGAKTSSSSSSSSSKSASPQRASPQRASPQRASPQRASPRAIAAAFTAAVALKDTNRFHNIPKELQVKIMKMAKKMKKRLSKYAIYKKIYNDRQTFINWLDELKRDGVDSKMRVRNPLRKGGLIYTNKPNGLYPILYNLCFQVLQGSYVYEGVPRPVKSFYRTQSKFYNKPLDSPPKSKSS
jgi:hypothetical protein